MVVAFAVAAGGFAAANAQSLEAPPGTLTLDRMDESARFGIQAGFDKIDDVKLSDGFVMRYELYGQYVLPNRLLGVYAQVPFAHLFDFNGDDHTALSNIDFGGFFLPTHRSDLIVRVGLALPTASESSARRAVNLLAAFERLTDLLLAAPNYTSLRLSVSTLQERGVAFFRGDLGFDLVVDKPANDRGPSVYLRANLAAGARLGPVDLAAEFVNLGGLDGTVSGGIDNRFFHTLGVGLSTRGTDQFRIGTVFPLDKGFRGEIWIVSLGYQHTLN
jgi:hypothetical protein